jgi:hypothetical protein
MPLFPNDFKLLFKQVVTDPEGLNLPTLLSSTKTVGIAKGGEGYLTGVYGYSERASGIYARLRCTMHTGGRQTWSHLTGKFTAIELLEQEKSSKAAKR